MWTPQRTTAGDYATVGGQLYGLGWELGHIRGFRTVSHSGASGAFVLRFVDEPVTVIVLTNLDLAAGPQAAVLARSIAERLYPALESPRRLAPTKDPDAALTARVLQTLGTLGADQEEGVITATYRASLQRMPVDRRQAVVAQLQRIRSLVHLATDSMRHAWDAAELTHRSVHYRGVTDGPLVYVTVDVTRDGRVAGVRTVP